MVARFEATGRTSGPPARRLRAAALAPFLLATNLRSHRRASRRRLLLASDPCLATHMEAGWLAPATDWRAVAGSTWDWAAGRRLIEA